MLNSSAVTQAPPCGRSADGDQIPCEWPPLWTLTAALGSVLVFSFIQAILYFISDPGTKKVKVYSTGCTVQYVYCTVCIHHFGQICL